MHFPRRRLGGIRGDFVEYTPAKAADAAILVRLAPEIEPAPFQCRKLWNRSGRDQRYRHPLAAAIDAGDARDAAQ